MVIAPESDEIWLANLNPTVGSEIKKSRPRVIVSPTELNSQLRTVEEVRLSKKLGHASAKILALMLATLQEVFAE